MRKRAFLFGALVLGGSVTHAQMRWTGSGWAGTPTNLQVLPKDIPPRELIDVMKSFTIALDVGCEHCHAGNADDLSTFTFRADDKPTKQVARRMLAMLSDINRTLDTVGEPAAPGTQKVTCFTCHRGQTKPLKGPAGGRGVGPVR